MTTRHEMTSEESAAELPAPGVGWQVVAMVIAAISGGIVVGFVWFLYEVSR